MTATRRPAPAGRLATLLLLLLPLVLLGACKDGAPPPDRAFLAFVEAAAAGEHDRAWEMLSRETRLAADELVRATADQIRALGETPPADGKELLFGTGGLQLVRSLGEVDVASRDGDRARLKVSDAEGAGVEVEMRLEDGAWRLYLPL